MVDVSNFKPNKTGIVISIILVVLIIIYVVGMFILYDTKTWVFQEYEPKDLPNTTRPLISVRFLSDDEIAHRKQLFTDVPGPS